MTIKDTVYSTHQKLKATTNPPVKLSHLYELFAAAFGFNSYASLKNAAILTHLAEPSISNQDAIQQRASLLGYKAFPVDELANILDEEGIGAITFIELAVLLKEGDELTGDVLDQLRSVDVNPWANYCLALHYENFSEDDEPVGSGYWYTQMQAGRQLSEIEKTWALEYKDQLSNESKYELHLRKAASLGCDLALLDLAEKYGETAFFEGDYLNVSVDPAEVAEIARDLGRGKDQHHWLTIAAEAGNTEAMRELIESFDSNDLTRCWTWVYLSQLLGNDLTQDRYHAINEDGSSYDDDVGGPMDVVGEDGIDLPSLEPELDALARSNAENLFKRIDSKTLSRNSRT